MEKRIRFLRILRVIWIVLGAAAMCYVLFVTKKSNLILAAAFIAGFAAIELPLRKLEDAQRSDNQDETIEKTEE